MNNQNRVPYVPQNIYDQNQINYNNKGFNINSTNQINFPDTSNNIKPMINNNIPTYNFNNTNSSSNNYTFINSKITQDKLSIFNQLHRDTCTMSSNLIPNNAVLIQNNSIMNLLIKLSGSSQQDGRISYTQINQGESKIFNRNCNSIYKLNVTSAEGIKGSIFNIKSGCIYQIDSSFNLCDPNGNTTLSTFEEYSPIFEWKNAYLAFSNQFDNSFSRNSSLNNIIIVNKANNSLNASIMSDSVNNFEGNVEIEPLIYLNYNRKPGRYIGKISKISDEEINKYELETGNIYVWDDTMGLVNYTRNNSPVSKTIDNSDRNNKNRNEDKRNFLTNKIWLMIKAYLKNNPNKKKIKDFNYLLFRFIQIINCTSNNIQIRVQSRKTGSEEFMNVKPTENYNWKRLDGEYLTEIVFSNMKSKRYNLRSDNQYKIDSLHQMVNVSSNTVIKPVRDTFNTDELVYFDEITNTYQKKKIDYSDEFPINPNINNNNKTNNLIKPDLNIYEYYQNKKPNYIPGNPFVDQDFSPNKCTLAAIDPLTGVRCKPHFLHLPDSLTPKQINSYIFKRPKDIFRGQYCLYKDEICYDDVKQGSLGNCYLMSVIASLSQKPDLISSIFKSTTVNPDGFYEIFFWENGKKKVMFVDDYLVLSNGEEGYPFAIPNGNELWVMLIEKAYAKYEGGYSNIIGGVMATELTWLTGAMSRCLNLNNQNSWIEIVNSIKAGYIITSASLAGTGNHFNMSAGGISNGHAYSVLDAREFRDYSKNIKLIKVRNPWGRVEWKGDYNDNCRNWTPELKKFFGFNEQAKDDGVFYMTFEDFKNEFASIIICCLEARN